MFSLLNQNVLLGVCGCVCECVCGCIFISENVGDAIQYAFMSFLEVADSGACLDSLVSPEN